jgi:hypothetical protein
MARKPEGERALTKAERDARHRKRRAAYMTDLEQREARKDEALRRIAEEARTLREAREIAAEARGERKCQR